MVQNRSFEEAFAHFIQAQKEILLALVALLSGIIEIVDGGQDSKIQESINSFLILIKSFLDQLINKIPKDQYHEYEMKRGAILAVQSVIDDEIERIKNKKSLSHEDNVKLKVYNSIRSVFEKELIDTVNTQKQAYTSTLRKVEIE